MIQRRAAVRGLAVLPLALITSFALCGVLVPHLANATSTAASTAPTSQPMDMGNMQNMQPGHAQTQTGQISQAQSSLQHEIQVVNSIHLPVPDEVWSEFNHRASGLFILLWGLTALIVGLQWPRKTWFRFVPPLVLLGLVEFLFLRIDPKVWPTGPIGFWESFQSPEVTQHRIFILLIFAIAIVELLRAADRLPSLARIYAIPALALFGAIFLFFHQHGGPGMQQAMQQMSDPSMAATPAMQRMSSSMSLIKNEHLWFSILGVGFAVTKLLGDAGRLPGRLGVTLWPIFAILLGLYMLGYSE